MSRTPNGRRRAPRVPFALLVTGLLLGGLVLLLALNTASAANELRRSTLATRDQEVGADLAQLRNEVAASAAPGNLARAAAQLGMVPNGNPAFIVELPDGQTVLRGHAKAVSDDPLDLPSGTPHAVPAPTNRVAPSPTTSATKSSATPSPTATPSAGHHPKKAKHRKQQRAAHDTRSAPPSPTPTPTPTITLPGGNK